MTEFLNIWLPLIVSALIHASFALGVSVFTLLSGHVMSKKESARRLRELSSAYIFGSFATTVVGMIAIIFIFAQFPFVMSGRFWSVLCGVATGIGLAVILFYYRWGKKKGTQLWLPRKAAGYLADRAKNTTECFEAFILGVASVILESLFVIAPLIIAASVIVNIDTAWQAIVILGYSLVAVMPIVALCICNRRGGKISAFQRWRERNKKFLQISAGSLLIILGLYMFVYRTLGG